MTHRLRSVGLEYAETAPVRLVFVAKIPAAPEAVFEAFTDVEGWPRWFRQVRDARSTDGGKRREIRLMGGTRFRETVMAADPYERYAYRVDETNVPGLRALLEEWTLRPSDGGTVVRYVFAVDGTAVLRGAVRAMRPGLRRAFHQAVRNLDRMVAAV
ncbi:SRPBCC family protein [Streptomyces rugosispiralis]|uniref:SRPBCC family protein n=1 Tax=Streptomyces rugosispiralis TaxID=2967341 RepID=A0ABT1USI4_9ACTN|nr:SRPBCC family protein [Streptomyces rugosispiralis]MCQ8188002.1 SRPBCC family protein [Streptomyces rugosispiralis]